MTILLAFLSRYWVHIAVVVAIFAGLGYVYKQGWDSRDADWKADTVQREAFGRAERERLHLANDQIGINMAVIAAQQSKKREVEYHEVVKHKTVYRDNPDAGKCAILDSFVCVIDTAYEGLPESAADTCRQDDTSGRLSDIELLSFATDAKGICTAWRDEVIWWRERESQIQLLESSHGR